MKLIVGLGNPGSKYARTPHNAGYMMLDRLSQHLLNQPLQMASTSLKWEKEGVFDAEISKFVIETQGCKQELVLFKPTTFMNESGRAVRKYIEKNSLDIKKDLIILHDDLDIVLGEYKYQFAKAPKGHNGIISIENHLKTNQFWRMRIGIEAREYKNIPGEEYVLMPFNEGQMNLLHQTVDTALKESDFLKTISE